MKGEKTYLELNSEEREVILNLALNRLKELADADDFLNPEYHPTKTFIKKLAAYGRKVEML